MSSNREITNSAETKIFWESNQQVFKELLTFIDFADDKLNIAFAEINFAQDRDLLIKTLIEHPNCQDIQFVVLDFPDPNLRFLRDEIVKALKSREIDADKKLILLLKGLEKSIGILDEYPDILVNLNYVRDDFRHSVCHPIIFFLPEYALTHLAKYAPDFWAWSRKTFYFKSIKSDLTDTLNNTLFSNKHINSLRLHDKKERIDLLLRLLSEYNSSDEKNSTTVINIYNELGVACYTIRDYQQAIYYFKKSLDSKNIVNNHVPRANALIGLGNVYDSLDKYDKAISYYQQSIKVAQEINDRNRIANAFCSLGNTYSSLGEYQKAIYCCQQSLEIAREINDHNVIVSSLGNLGIAYYYMGEYLQALDYYQQSLKIAREISDYYSEANSLNNLGNIYNSLGEYQRVIDYCKRSFEIAQQIGDCRLAAASLGNSGIAYSRIGEDKQALDYYQQSLEIAKKIGDHRSEANAWFNLGNTQKNLQKNLEAKAAYENARQLFQVMGLVQYVEYCAQEIVNLEERDNDQ